MIATADPTTWPDVAAGIIIAVSILLAICLAVFASHWGRWMDHRERMANARGTEEAVHQRVTRECGQWCPRCGTATGLRKLDGAITK